MSTKTNILSLIKRGSTSLPPRVLLAGPEGIGKTTFGAGAPSPLFIAAEEGLTGHDHLQRFQPTSTDQLHELFDQLMVDIGGFKNIVVDTTDWLERLIHKSLCSKDGKSGIEDFGYGKGYVAAEEELVRILAKLDQIRTKHSVGIILLAHVEISRFDDPRGGSWNRYSLKGNKKFTGVLREWPEACLFAVNEVFQTKKGGEKSTIAGERVIHTEWSTAWDAKNRLGLPPTIPFPQTGGWDAFSAAVTAASPATARAKAIALYKSATKIEDKDRAAWVKWMDAIEAKPIDAINKAIASLEALQ
jgi:hypothetical protein